MNGSEADKALEKGIKVSANIMNNLHEAGLYNLSQNGKFVGMREVLTTSSRSLADSIR